MSATSAEQGRAASESVLVVALHDRAAIHVSGKDRVSWLNGLVTCDLAKLGAGEGAYGLLVEKKGRLQADMFVVPAAGDAGELLLLVPAPQRDAVLATLDHHLIMEDVELAAVEVAAFAAFGPRAAELSPAPAYAAILPTPAFGDTARGAVFASPKDDALADRIAAETARIGGVVGDDAGFEEVRIERGLPRFGVEVDATLYPQEASLEKLAVSFSKGCYLGQEVVYMLEHRGHVKRKLVPLDLEGDAPPSAGDKVTSVAGDEVGEIRSATLGPTTAKPVAIAMVKWAHTKPDTELRVGGRTARVRLFP